MAFAQGEVVAVVIPPNAYVYAIAFLVLAAIAEFALGLVAIKRVRALGRWEEFGSPTPLRTRGLSHRLVFIEAAPRDRRVFVAYYVAARLLLVAWLAVIALAFALFFATRR